MQNIKITIIQSDLLWEDIPGNIAQFDRKISLIKDDVDLIILPEMFNTAFSMNPSVCAEMQGGASFIWLKEKASEKKCVITGSVLTNEDSRFYNRLIWMNPDGLHQHYDKKHLFRFAGEHEVFSPGTEKITPSCKGWNFRPLVCYDLRFPVWSRNSFINEKFGYDCLIYIANWPEKRRDAWISLLVARAIENQSYVIGVNRVGKDRKGNVYSGDSMVIHPTGKIILQIEAHKEETATVSLSYEDMQGFRSQFRVATDWDSFSMGNQKGIPTL